jgi:hypothetical protein
LGIYFFQFFYYAAHAFVEGVGLEAVVLGYLDVGVAVESFTNVKIGFC